MQRTRVTSSTIESIGYEQGILEIEFRDGDVYQYQGVPQGIYNELMAASSQGQYFHQNIKDIYSYEKIS